VNYRADLQNLTIYKLKLPHLTVGELTKQLPLKERRKINTIQPPGETTTELLLKYQHQDWMLEK
jgi:hypothetical protein